MKSEPGRASAGGARCRKKKRKKSTQPKEQPARAAWCETIREKSVGATQLWSARDLGRALGFDSGGGNLSRNFHHGWRDKFARDVDYEIDARGAIWLTEIGVRRTLKLVADGANPARAAIAQKLLKKHSSDRRYDADAAPMKEWNMKKKGKTNDVERTMERLAAEPQKAVTAPGGTKKKIAQLGGTKTSTLGGAKKAKKGVLTSLSTQESATPTGDCSTSGMSKLRAGVERMRARRRGEI